ncbi:hypothetical protein D3C72_2150060 [compost metagenome]
MPGAEGDQGHDQMKNGEADDHRQRLLEDIQEILEAEADASGEGQESKQPGRQIRIRGQQSTEQNADHNAGWRNQRHHAIQPLIQNVEHRRQHSYPVFFYLLYILTAVCTGIAFSAFKVTVSSAS